MVNGKTKGEMVEVDRYGKMVVFTKDIGKTIWPTAKAG